MTSSTSQWNPEDVLEIGQVSSGVTCVGYAHSKHRRCNEPISAAKRQQASKLLLQLGKQDFSSPEIGESPLLLAPLLSCNRKQHQDQISTVIDEWCDQIEGYQIKKGAEQESAAKFEKAKLVGPTTLQTWLALLAHARLSGLPQLFGKFVLNLFR